MAAGCVFVCLSGMTTTGAAREYCLLCRVRKCCSAKKRKITLFYFIGVTFVTAPYTSVSINYTVYRPTAKLCQLSCQTQFDLFLKKPNTLRGVSTVPDGPWQVARRRWVTLWNAVIYARTHCGKKLLPTLQWLKCMYHQKWSLNQWLGYCLFIFLLCLQCYSVTISCVCTICV